MPPRRRPPPEQQSFWSEPVPAEPASAEPASEKLAPEEPAPQYGRSSPLDNLPDVRDGLTRKERIILYTLHEAQKERRGRYVGTAMLYGRVVERIDMSVEEFQRILQRMVGVQGGHSVPRPSPFSGPLPDEDDGVEKG